MEMSTDRAAAITAWVRQQRWFGDKSRQLDSSTFGSLGAVTLDNASIDLLTIDFHFRDGQRSSYFLAIVGGSVSDAQDPGAVMDAFELPQFRLWFARGFAERRAIAFGERTMSWIPGLVALSPGDGRLLRSEQSNTSIQFGDDAVAKVFRRVQPGINPDVEIIQYLTERTDFRHVPRHLGTITLTTEREGGAVTLAAVQEYVPNQGDGWAWLLQQLGSSSAAAQDALAAVELLGSRTAEMHRALASPSVDPAFAPERLDSGEVDALLVRLRSEAERTMASILAAEARSQSDVRDLGESVMRTLETAKWLPGSLKTRVHGDYHLGQVLRTLDDFVIIDFEGEPSRSLAERREKSSPLKDVAGMLRSLDYAVATHERSKPGSGASIRSWGVRAQSAFLDGYRASLEDDVSSLVPHEAHAFLASLDLYLVEKALYEIRYELDNRPHWLEIPLSALEALTARHRMV